MSATQCSLFWHGGFCCRFRIWIPYDLVRLLNVNGTYLYTMYITRPHQVSFFRIKLYTYVRNSHLRNKTLYRTGQSVLLF